MILPDVNVLLYAYRSDSPHHSACRAFLSGIANNEAPFALSELVLSAFLRIVTHPRVFNPPSPLPDAVAFIDALRGRPNCVIIAPGPRHWKLFVDLCRSSDAKGNLVPDAYLAALAIESGCEWVTTDRDFSRFANLRWQHPLR